MVIRLVKDVREWLAQTGKPTKGSQRSALRVTFESILDLPSLLIAIAIGTIRRGPRDASVWQRPFAPK